MDSIDVWQSELHLKTLQCIVASGKVGHEWVRSLVVVGMRVSRGPHPFHCTGARVLAMRMAFRNCFFTLCFFSFFSCVRRLCSATLL